MQTTVADGGATWTLTSLKKVVAEAEPNCSKLCFTVHSESERRNCMEEPVAIASGESGDVTASRCVRSSAVDMQNTIEIVLNAFKFIIIDAV
jgi:hypothetical protein